LSKALTYLTFSQLTKTANMGKAIPPATAVSFEAALAELEAIVREMEAGQMPLEQSLAAYERGATLLKYCQEALGAAEQKLQILEGGKLSDFAGSLTSKERDA